MYLNSKLLQINKIDDDKFRERSVKILVMNHMFCDSIEKGTIDRLPSRNLYEERKYAGRNKIISGIAKEKK